MSALIRLMPQAVPMSNNPNNPNHHNSHGKTSNVNISPAKRRSSRIDMELFSQPEKQYQVFGDLLVRRKGAVLTRRTILKSDHFGSDLSSKTMRLIGAPNFRQATSSIFGVAQPTVAGLSAILRLLRCGPPDRCQAESTCIWVSTREEPLIYVNGRPFVLRDGENPTENIRAYAGISTARLEQMEERLKADILEESASNNGILLVHDETSEGLKIIPCLTSVETVMTSQEIFESMKAAGFCVRYHRIPISHEQAPMDDYIDEYIALFRELPDNCSVVFSCGIGVGRTTYSMVLGVLLREAFHDNAIVELQNAHGSPSNGEEQTAKAILRLVSLLEQGMKSSMGNDSDRTAIQWTLARSSLITDFKDAVLGNYHVINELVKVLDNGPTCKKLVDEAIDKCENPINLRDQILLHRVKHDVDGKSNALEIAISYLERYFCLIAFTAFIYDPTLRDGQAFSQWIKNRRDLWNMLQNLRRGPDRLKSFRPIHDLHALGVPSVEKHTQMREYHVIKSRPGAVLSAHTILKVDHWMTTSVISSAFVGAPNFRKIGPYHVYATSQPTLSALRAIVGELGKNGELVCWVNVREEPLVYINDDPYVLRDQYASLRNIKTYSGISPERIELMEDRLKEDILNEASTYHHKVLVHSESEKETIIPCWLSIEDGHAVKTLKELFAIENRASSGMVEYVRLPITAEDAPETEDLDNLMQIVHSVGSQPAAFVFNCQMGASRSTLCAIATTMILNWKQGKCGLEKLVHELPRRSAGLFYRVVHAMVRVLKRGMECKSIVDWLIDNSESVINLRDAIEKYRTEAQSSGDPNDCRRARRKAAAALKRYCLLILFQAYLLELPTQIKIIESFTAWLVRHQELVKLLDEIDKGSVETWIDEPLKTPGPGLAPPSEVLQVVQNRRGSVLSTMTILKFDHFPGCQKMGLKERIDGAPNFRELSLNYGADFKVYGLAMPTASGVVNTLRRVQNSVLWFCLREEPVIYIGDNPYVLRIVKDPVNNLEMTGIISERVELMEERLKRDVLDELQLYGGKLLLHEEDPATSETVPTWETILPGQVKTPREVMECAMQKFSQLHYVRIPITDEQAPIPEVFDLLIQELWSNAASSTPRRPIFNCQMGRGRTSTGMIIATVLELIRTKYGPACSDPVEEYTVIGDGTETPVSEPEDNPATLHYLRGEYKLILQLLQVLEHGQLSKKIVDEAVDLCDDIQNLRTAIYDYRQRGEIIRGQHYLLRYFFLICFAEYLVQLHLEADWNRLIREALPSPTFLEWLQGRREIGNMASRKELLDLS